MLASNSSPRRLLSVTEAASGLGQLCDSESHRNFVYGKFILILCGTLLNTTSVTYNFLNRKEIVDAVGEGYGLFVDIVVYGEFFSLWGFIIMVMVKGCVGFYEGRIRDFKVAVDNFAVSSHFSFFAMASAWQISNICRIPHVFSTVFREIQLDMNEQIGNRGPIPYRYAQLYWEGAANVVYVCIVLLMPFLFVLPMVAVLVKLKIMAAIIDGPFLEYSLSSYIRYFAFFMNVASVAKEDRRYLYWILLGPEFFHVGEEFETLMFDALRIKYGIHFALCWWVQYNSKDFASAAIVNTDMTETVVEMI